MGRPKQKSSELANLASHTTQFIADQMCMENEERDGEGEREGAEKGKAKQGRKSNPETHRIGCRSVVGWIRCH